MELHILFNGKTNQYYQPTEGCVINIDCNDISGSPISRDFTYPPSCCISGGVTSASGTYIQIKDGSNLYPFIVSESVQDILDCKNQCCGGGTIVEPPRIPLQKYVYQSSIGVVVLPFEEVREVIVHNRNSIDIIVTWDGSLGSNGNDMIVPANGTNSISLTSVEGYITSLASSLGLYGYGSVSPNTIAYNFKN